MIKNFLTENLRFEYYKREGDAKIEANFENLIIHKLPWGHARSHKKFGPDRFSRFDVYWIQTDKQTDRQTSQIYV